MMAWAAREAHRGPLSTVVQPPPGPCQASAPWSPPCCLPAQPGSVPLQPPASTASPLPPLVSMPEQHSAGLAASPQQSLSREATQQWSGHTAQGHSGAWASGPPSFHLAYSLPGSRAGHLKGLVTAAVVRSRISCPVWAWAAGGGHQVGMGPAAQGAPGCRAWGGARRGRQPEVPDSPSGQSSPGQRVGGAERGWGTRVRSRRGLAQGSRWRPFRRRWGSGRAQLRPRAASYSDPASVAQLEGTAIRLWDGLPRTPGLRAGQRGRAHRWDGSRGARPGGPAARGRAGCAGAAHTTRVRAPRRRAGRPGPLSVQTAAPADARAPIGAPRPPPAAPEALGPQLLGGWTRRGPAPPPARPRPRGPWSRGPARGRPPARRFMERPRPGRRGQRDPAGPCEPPAPRHHGTQGPACPAAYPPTCPCALRARGPPARGGGAGGPPPCRGSPAPPRGSPRPGTRRCGAALGGEGVKFLGWGPGRERLESC